MAVAYQLELIEQGHTVVSWQGVRRDESLNRRNVKKFERLDAHLYVFRPLVDWTAEQVFAYAAKHEIEPNPLYKCGMNRVGCMPCINASKAEVKEIAIRFPEHVERIADWEKKVGACSKRQAATFFPAPSRGKAFNDRRAYAKSNDVHAVVEWSKTSHGGRQYSLLDTLIDPAECSSSYGLCG
jgi:3'-phosphoadenosine 5'-phosphosulfate sulfotransferase (PAPS reductase)/FAD synthetase